MSRAPTAAAAAATPAASPGPDRAARLIARVEALRRSSPARAWTALERGFKPALRDASESGRGTLWRTRGHILRSFRRAAEAAAAYRRAERWFARAGDVRERGRCAIGLVDALMYLGRYREALRTSARGQRLLGRAGDRQALSRLLNNEANVYHRIDRPDLALLRYQRARRALRSAGDRTGAARVDINVANCLSLLGRTARARALYGSAHRTHERAGLAVDALHASYNLAYLDFLEHRHERALEGLAAVRGEASRAGVPALSAVARLDMAEILLHLGGHDEALETGVAAASECGTLGLKYERAKAETLAALAELRLGRPRAARARLDRSLAVFHAEGNLVWVGETLVALATLAWERGDPRTAGGLLLAAAHRFARAADAEREGCARALLVRARIESGQVAAAGEELRRLRARARRGSPRLRHLILAAEGRLAIARGDTRRARLALERAARASEQLAARILDEQWRASFWGEWGWPHLDLAALHLDEGRVAAALEALERGRGRALAGPTLGRLSAGPDPLPQGVRSWAAAYLGRDRDRATRSAAGPAPAATPLPRREGAPVAVSVQRRLRAGLGHSVRAADLRRALPEGSLLVDYMIHRGALDALAVTRDGCRAVRGLAREETLRRLVHGLLFALRGAALHPCTDGEPGSGARAEDPPELAELAAFALWPVLARHGAAGAAGRGGEAGSGGAGDDSRGAVRRLFLVPTGILTRIPWPALPAPDGRALCESTSTVVVPGLRLGLAPRDGATPAGPPLIVGAGAGELGHVGSEIEALGRLFPDAVVLADREATAARFLELAPSARWIHFAGHGLYRPDAPFQSGLRLHDRWIVAGELAETRLSASWVTLAACQTARALVRPGEEWFGLPRSLLLAGAGAVVASQWDIADVAAARLMMDLYTRLAGGGALEDSLAAAQALRRQEGGHPVEWAGFVVLSGPHGGRVAPLASDRPASLRSPHPGGQPCLSA